MLTYVFEHNNVPLYEQVYQCMKHDIIEGVLQPGEKLPSKRTFATHNGISTITIQNAYDQLISEGYIYHSKERVLCVGYRRNKTDSEGESYFTGYPCAGGTGEI